MECTMRRPVRTILKTGGTPRGYPAEFRNTVVSPGVSRTTEMDADLRFWRFGAGQKCALFAFTRQRSGDQDPHRPLQVLLRGGGALLTSPASDYCGSGSRRSPPELARIRAELPEVKSLLAKLQDQSLAHLRSNLAHPEAFNRLDRLDREIAEAAYELDLNRIPLDGIVPTPPRAPGLERDVDFERGMDLGIGP